MDEMNRIIERVCLQVRKYTTRVAADYNGGRDGMPADVEPCNFDYPLMFTGCRVSV